MFDRRRIVPLALLVLGGTLASADVLHLKRGGRIEGVVVRETAFDVTVDVSMGRVSIPRTNIESIERKESALSEYRARVSRLSPGDLGGLVGLARFANESGLHAEARALWARVASLDPRNVEAHQALGHILVGGDYVDESEYNRERGLVYFEHRWMTPAEQESLLRERERRSIDERFIEESRRASREADERARRAEAEAARARAEASAALPVWPYVGPIVVGAPGWGGYSAGCVGVSCTTVPQIWPVPPSPQATPIQPPPHVRPVRPSSIR